MINRTLAISEPEFKSIEEITAQGILLGHGKFGFAYRIGDRVYKIYLEPVNESHSYNPAEVSARYWNKTYSQIYDGKYQHLATAKYTNITSEKSKKKYPVLITPFVDGDEMTRYCFCIPARGFKKFRNAFKALSLDMEDFNKPGNIRISSDGDFLSIDFDNVFVLPVKKGFCYAIYDCPSPRTRNLQQSKFFNTFRSNPIPTINVNNNSLNENTQQELELLKPRLPV